MLAEGTNILSGVFCYIQPSFHYDDPQGDITANLGYDGSGLKADLLLRVKLTLVLSGPTSWAGSLGHDKHHFIKGYTCPFVSRMES